MISERRKGMLHWGTRDSLTVLRYLAVRESLDSKNLFDSNSLKSLKKPTIVWRAAARWTLVRIKILFHWHLMAHRIDCFCPENRTVPTTGHYRSTGITVPTVLVFNYVLNPHSQIRQLFEILPNFMVTTMYFINIWDNNQIGNMVLPNSPHWNKSILLQLSKPKHSSNQIKNIILK